MIRQGVTLDHWADSERIAVPGLADLSPAAYGTTQKEAIAYVRDVLATHGIVPDRIDTVSIGELREAGLIPKPGPMGEALRETRAR